MENINHMPTYKWTFLANIHSGSTSLGCTRYMTIVLSDKHNKGPRVFFKKSDFFTNECDEFGVISNNIGKQFRKFRQYTRDSIRMKKIFLCHMTSKYI